MVVPGRGARIKKLGNLNIIEVILVMAANTLNEKELIVN